jgi:hypothetical protein
MEWDRGGSPLFFSQWCKYRHPVNQDFILLTGFGLKLRITIYSLTDGETSYIQGYKSAIGCRYCLQDHRYGSDWRRGREQVTHIRQIANTLLLWNGTTTENICACMMQEIAITSSE